jgi:hypothetical protein
VLTTDREIVLVDLISGSCEKSMTVPTEIELAKFHCILDLDKLLVSSSEGDVYVCDYNRGVLRKLENIRLETSDAYIIKLDSNRIMLSGMNDEILKYDIAEMRCEKLDVKAASIRGRAFRATITGGAVLADGTVAAGTYDGMMFTLTPDLRIKTTFGRLYSTGQLRNFIKLNNDQVIGVYGGIKDAGHVFHFSRDRGFVDLGRPRVIKDNIELRDMETEWASIHYISCLAYDQENDCMSVASGEEYGCVIQYKGVAHFRS